MADVREEESDPVDSSPTPPSVDIDAIAAQLFALSERLDSLEIRVDAQAKGIRLELASLREDVREALGLLRVLATAQGRLDQERENDRKALRDVAGSIAELAADIDGVSAEIQEFRRGRSSASNFDAQALANSIEHMISQHRGDTAAIVTRITSLETSIGCAPDAVRKIEGSGLLGQMHAVNNARSLATIAIGTFLAGGGVVAAIMQLLGGK